MGISFVRRGFLCRSVRQRDVPNHVLTRRNQLVDDRSRVPIKQLGFGGIWRRCVFGRTRVRGNDDDNNRI
jgi:hypothetical protein